MDQSKGRNERFFELGQAVGLNLGETKVRFSRPGEDAEHAHVQLQAILDAQAAGEAGGGPAQFTAQQMSQASRLEQGLRLAVGKKVYNDLYVQVTQLKAAAERMRQVDLSPGGAPAAPEDAAGEHPATGAYDADLEVWSRNVAMALEHMHWRAKPDCSDTMSTCTYDRL